MEIYSEESKKEGIKWKKFINKHKENILFIITILLSVSATILQMYLFLILPDDINFGTLYYVGRLYILIPLNYYDGHVIKPTILTYFIFSYCIIANIISGLFLLQKSYSKKLNYIIPIYWIQYLVLVISSVVHNNQINLWSYYRGQNYVFVIGLGLLSLFLSFPLQLKMLISQKTFREWFTSTEEKEQFKYHSGFWFFSLFNRGLFLISYLFTSIFVILAFSNTFNNSHSYDIVFFIYLISFFLNSLWLFSVIIGEKLLYNRIKYKQIKEYLNTEEYDLAVISTELEMSVDKLERILQRKIKREKLHGIIIPDIHRYLPISIKEEVETNVEDIIEDEITIEKEHLEGAYKTLVKYLIEIKPNLQVSLDRLTELSKTTKRLTEMIINDLLKYYPDIGEYYSLEQVFIRKKDTEKILREILTNPLQKLRSYTCYNCGEKIDINMASCPNCNEKIKRCSTCKLPISFKETIGECKKCNSQAHLIHIQEWVKTNGKCPNCLRPLTLKQIKQVK